MMKISKIRDRGQLFIVICNTGNKKKNCTIYHDGLLRQDKKKQDLFLIIHESAHGSLGTKQ